MNYAEISKETVGLLHQSYASLKKSPLPAAIRVLVELRVSQINGCDYCCRIHSEEARKLGVAQEKLDLLPAWQNASIYSAEENLVLRYAEAVTNLQEERSQILEELRQMYSDRHIVDLTACIALMNALNRLAIYLRED